MQKFICSVCGYIHEGEAPVNCPQCGAAASKFKEYTGEATSWADEHVIGVAEGVDERSRSLTASTGLFAIGMLSRPCLRPSSYARLFSSERSVSRAWDTSFSNR